jgi:hypothetical protein
MSSIAWRAALGLALLVAPCALGAERRFVQLTGWGGGRPEEVVPQAAEVGFDELLVGGRDRAYLARYVEMGRKHGVGIYGVIHLSDLADWKKRRPGIAPPLQEMNAEETAALKRIQADKSKWKSGYQHGGEPVRGLEVLTSSLLCFHRPEVRTFFEEQIRDLLGTAGLRGIALDYFGYQNYRCCRCGESMAALEAWRRRHPGVPADKAQEQFSLESLVEFVNTLARFTRTVRTDARVTCHVYPVFLPEPLYGNRLDVDYCGQTASWYFDPLWSLDKVRRYTGVICGQEKKYFARAEGVPMIGIYVREVFCPYKSPERLAGELEAILAGGGDRLQVCSFNDVLKDPATREVFRRMFGRTGGAAAKTGK